jgi:hypothetical protein
VKESIERSTSLAVASRLEQFDGIPIRIFDLNLPPAWAGFHVIPKVHASVLQSFYRAREVVYAQDDAIPAAWLLPKTIWHRSRPGRSRAAEKQGEIIERHSGERGELLVLQLETKLAGIERYGALHIRCLVTDAMYGDDRSLVALVGSIGDGGGSFSFSLH